ncbi:transposase [Paraburkholderia sp. CNPSo 3274]|nr:transposase [Paraburkholderia sp. CNPSo 3274]MCP3711872.1 transposase [Paraburkholderia sp. CNPSo 3274]
MFRFNEELTAHTHRSSVDFRMGIDGMPIPVEQATRLNPMISAPLPA